MTYKQIIDDVREIKNAISDDSDLEDLWILAKVNAYRSLHIAHEFAMTNQISPSWLQRIYNINVEKTNLNGLASESVGMKSSFGRLVIPEVILLPDNQGVKSISGSSGMTQYEECDFSYLTTVAYMNDAKYNGRKTIPEGMGYYAKVGSEIFLWPYIMKASSIIVAEDPLTVQILENGVLRQQTLNDRYPLDIALAQKAIIDFVTKDLAISEGTVVDIINDSQSELNILKGNAFKKPVQRAEGAGS